MLPKKESGQVKGAVKNWEESGHFVFLSSFQDGCESRCHGFTENGNFDIPGVVGAPSHCHRQSRNELREALRLC